MKTISIFIVALVLCGTTATTGAVHTKPALYSHDTPRDCTFTIKGTFNGIVVDVEITVSGVSLLECALLKAGVTKAIK
jgi:hypothetical protein